MIPMARNSHKLDYPALQGEVVVARMPAGVKPIPAMKRSLSNVPQVGVRIDDDKAETLQFGHLPRNSTTHALLRDDSGRIVGSFSMNVGSDNSRSASLNLRPDPSRPPVAEAIRDRRVAPNRSLETVLKDKGLHVDEMVVMPHVGSEGFQLIHKDAFEVPQADQGHTDIQVKLADFNLRYDPRFNPAMPDDLRSRDIGVAKVHRPNIVAQDPNAPDILGRHYPGQAAHRVDLKTLPRQSSMLAIYEDAQGKVAASATILTSADGKQWGHYVVKEGDDYIDRPLDPAAMKNINGLQGIAELQKFSLSEAVVVSGNDSPLRDELNEQLAYGETLRETSMVVAKADIEIQAITEAERAAGMTSKQKLAEVSARNATPAIDNSTPATPSPTGPAPAPAPPQSRARNRQPRTSLPLGGFDDNAAALPDAIGNPAPTPAAVRTRPAPQRGPVPNTPISGHRQPAPTRQPQPVRAADPKLGRAFAIGPVTENDNGMKTALIGREMTAGRLTKQSFTDPNNRFPVGVVTVRDNMGDETTYVVRQQGGNVQLCEERGGKMHVASRDAFQSLFNEGIENGAQTKDGRTITGVALVGQNSKLDFTSSDRHAPDYTPTLSDMSESMRDAADVQLAKTPAPSHSLT
jgi:hypothetical protein